MIRLSLLFLFAVVTSFFYIGCGSSDQVEQKKPTQEVKKEEIKIPEKVVEGNFDISERYIAFNSAISFDPNDKGIIQDPLVGEFVKLKSGNKYSVLIHQFQNDSLTNEKISEVVFAFEISKPETNMKFFPERFVYYYLYYGANKSRIDGKTIHGFITFSIINNQFALGNIDFQINGIKKTFDQSDVDVEVLFKGSFRLPIVDFNQMGK